MNLEEIKQRTISVFRDVFDNESLQIDDETTANDIEDWDSLAHIGLVVAIEKEFKVKFDLFDIKALKNVGDMFKLIQRKTS